jgi:Kyakuja-Dileera-Zisupton transposase
MRRGFSLPCAVTASPCSSLTWSVAVNCMYFFFLSQISYRYSQVVPRAKYPTAIVQELIKTFGADLGGGYDIGCRFAITLDCSEVGRMAQKLRYKSLIGAFHGHGHIRRCQLSNLATYVVGLGLEDLEGCERFFSKSNALAASIRHASVFHRRQTITEYLKHTDTSETYAALSMLMHKLSAACLSL